MARADWQDRPQTDLAFYCAKVWQEKGENSLAANLPYERAWSSAIWIEPEARQ
ncbi:MAG: hypothetical protein JXQ73_19685 [Phycisphaerae bacterium]|nr:hypothetical protein [Phycisphaerae bacterium]